MRKLISIIFLVALCGVVFAGDMREPEYEWIERDPNLLDSLFRCYEAETGLPYLTLIADNWLTHNPLLKYNLHAGGRRGWTYLRGLDGRPTDKHPLEIGNLNGDDRVDVKDFAIYASRYK